MNEDDEAATAAGEALEAALLKATRTVEGELTRIVRTGEADLERLAQRIAETLARLALDGAFGAATPVAAPVESNGPASSFNQMAAALARAAMRGARFS